MSGPPGHGTGKVVCDFRLTGEDESAGEVPGDALEGEGDLVIPARLLEDQLHTLPGR